MAFPRDRASVVTAAVMDVVLHSEPAGELRREMKALARAPRAPGEDLRHALRKHLLSNAAAAELGRQIETILRDEFHEVRAQARDDTGLSDS
jgi:hypothetical protein